MNTNIDFDTSAMTVFDMSQKMARNFPGYKCSEECQLQITQEQVKIVSQQLMEVFTADMALSQEARAHVCEFYVNKDTYNWSSGIEPTEVLLSHPDFFQALMERLEQSRKQETLDFIGRDPKAAFQVIAGLVGRGQHDYLDFLKASEYSNRYHAVQAIDQVLRNFGDTRINTDASFHPAIADNPSLLKMAEALRGAAADLSVQTGAVLVVTVATCISVLNSMAQWRSNGLNALAEELSTQTDLLPWAKAMTERGALSYNTKTQLLGSEAMQRAQRVEFDVRQALFDGEHPLIFIHAKTLAQLYGRRVASNAMEQLHNLVYSTGLSVDDLEDTVVIETDVVPAASGQRVSDRRAQTTSADRQPSTSGTGHRP